MITVTVTLNLHKDEADALSFALSDVLCWCAGFASAREGMDCTDKGPMGTERLRDLNIKLKSALDEAEGKKA